MQGGVLLKHFKGIGIYVLIFIVVAVAVTLFTGGDNKQDLKYSELISQIQGGNVKSILLANQGTSAQIVFIDNPYAKLTNKYTVYIPDPTAFTNFVTTAADRFPKMEFEVVRPDSSIWTWLITTMLPMILIIVIFILFWFFVIQQSQGGSGGNRVMSFGKSRAKLSTDTKKKVTFEDVAGADEEKNELKEIVEFLKQPKKFVDLGARIPKGVLLVGPPGTGKTLLAKAVSGEANVPFFSISGSDFVEMFVGVGASRVRDLFEQAKKNTPCIIFIDEIDAVGRHRGAGMGGGHDEREQTLNQLLVEMDGFGVNEGVIILAATNRPDILDPALLRPGRFDRRVEVGLPDIKGREEILKVHARGKPFSDDVKLDELAKSTSGFTGADLENLLNEAALLAARENKKMIEMDDLKEATFKVIIGPEKKSRVMNDKEKNLTAYHEAGHAVLVKLISSTDKVDRVSIIPSGRAGGYTVHKPEEDSNYVTKNQLIENIVISLGGRAAEEIVLGEISTGAYGDLRFANGVARSMITKYGMSDKLGNLIFGDESDEVFIGRNFAQAHNYSEKTASEIDTEVKRLIDEAYDRTLSLLKENINKLHVIAEKLLEKEKIEGDEFEEIYASV